MTKVGWVDGRVLNCIQSQQTEDDWTWEDAIRAGCSALLQETIPEAYDLRRPWWTISHQRKTGACVGWAAADSVLRWHFVQAGKISQDTLLSARFIWMASKETDEFDTKPTTFIEVSGTSIKAALKVAHKYGCVLERDLPFRSGKLYRGKAEVFYARARQLRISNYFNLGKNLSHWRHWLAKEGPILTRLDADRTWHNASQTQGKLQVYYPHESNRGHAVALVGYTPDGFIVRNSWGRRWGDEGFAHASNAYALAAFDEAYGVVI